MAMRNSALTDEEAIQAFYQKVIESVSLDGHYLILLACDTYDVPYRSKDGERQEENFPQRCFSYFVCSICPVKLTQPALSYFANDNLLHNRTADWIVAPPELGFLFPAFDDRSANIYNALYYSRDLAENHKEFVDAVFHSEIPMPAAEQKETFQSILEETLCDDCRYEVVQAVHEQLREIVEEHKANKETEPPAISKETMKNVLETCEVSQEKVAAFEESYDKQFGAETDLSPCNLMESKLEIRMPEVTIHVNPERSDLVETRIIDDKKYILIRAEDEVVVNGVAIHIS